MRTWVLDSAAAADLDAQINYLLDQGFVAAAEHLATRVRGFLGDHLTVYPRTGKPLHRRDLWETWIPGTRLVL